MTHTERTIKWLRDRGFVVGKAERLIPTGKGYPQRKDLFGIIDLIAIKPGMTIGVQSTGVAHSAHVKTILKTEIENTRRWLLAGNHLWLISWRKLKTGPVQRTYKPRIEIFSLVRSDDDGDVHRTTHERDTKT